MKDAQKEALRELGYVGTNQDMENKFFYDSLGKKLPNSQGLYEWLGSLGFSAGSLQDRLKGCLKGLGYSGSINDMLKKAFKEKTFYNALKSILNKYSPNAHAYMFSQQTPMLGNELVVNGDFSNGTTGWSLGTGFSVSGGKLVINGGNAGSVFTTSASQLATVVGRTYRIQYDYTLTSGRFRFNPVAGVITTLVTTGSGTYTQDFVATAAGDMFIQAPDAATVGSIDNISVREILSYSDLLQGFHTGNYVESTGVTPASVDQPCGLVLDAAGSVGVELSPALEAANWAVVGTDATHVITWSTGTFRYQSDTTSPSLTIQKAGLLTIGKTYKVEITVSSYTSGSLKSDVSTGIIINAVGKFTFNVQSASAAFNLYRNSANVDMTISSISVREITGIHASQATSGYRPIERKGIVNLLLNSAAPATQTVSLAVGTYTLSLIGTGSVVITGLGAGTLTGTGASDLVTLTFSVAVAGAVIFTKAGSVTSFGLFAGTLTASQILQYGGIPTTTTAAASSSSGPGYLQFDGTDDRLTLGGAIGATSEFVVTVALSAKALATTQGIYDESTGGFRLYIAANGSVSLDKNGTGVLVTSPVGSVVANSKLVLSFVLSGGTAKVRKNGVQTASASSALTSVGTGAGTIGSGSAGTIPFAGDIYFFSAIKGTLSDAEITLLEKQAALLAGVTLP